MLGECIDHLKENEDVIRSDLHLTGKNLNGPQENFGISKRAERWSGTTEAYIGRTQL